MNADDPTLSIETDLTGAAANVSLTGELDIHTAPRLLDELRSLANREITEVALRARGVSFTDSAGIRALVVGRQQMTRAGGDLRIVEMSEPLRRVLEMTGLLDLFGAS